MSRTERATSQVARRFVRRLARLVALVLALRLLAAVAGPLIAAVAGSVLFIGAGVRWWARFEARLDRPRPSAQVVRRPAPGVDERRHLAFAQALAIVAARYMAECEAENRP
jgi:O-antigen/teichoic acid export membrane protein